MNMKKTLEEHIQAVQLTSREVLSASPETSLIEVAHLMLSQKRMRRSISHICPPGGIRAHSSQPRRILSTMLS